MIPVRSSTVLRMRLPSAQVSVRGEGVAGRREARFRFPVREDGERSASGSRAASCLAGGDGFCGRRPTIAILYNTFRSTCRGVAMKEMR